MVNDYTRNFGYFLENSDEDYAVSAAFLEEYHHRFLGNKKNMEWLDVGRGTGTKVINILKGNENYRGLLNLSDIELDFIEPSKDLKEIALERFSQGGLSGTIRQISLLKWEEFVKVQRGSYDIITLFHSVYGIDISYLNRIIDYLKDGGYACIVVESPDSDLYKIKRELFPQVFKEDFVSFYEAVIDSLRY